MADYNGHKSAKLLIFQLEFQNLQVCLNWYTITICAFLLTQPYSTAIFHFAQTKINIKVKESIHRLPHSTQNGGLRGKGGSSAENLGSSGGSHLQYFLPASRNNKWGTYILKDGIFTTLLFCKFLLHTLKLRLYGC